MPCKKILIASGLLFSGLIWGIISASAEYGDILFKRPEPKVKEAAEGAKLEEKLEGQKPVPPAVFPHWIHRIRFRCLVCHPFIFKMKRGANPVTMIKIQAGEFCGKCHNGRIAFALALDACPRCHYRSVVGKTAEQKDGIDPKAEAKAGKIIYEKWCTPCHGVTGRGNGPAAPSLVPKPRNFFDGVFKIRTTPSGELPLDDDIVNIIEKGMPGSSMPAWKGLITTLQAQQAAAYIKTLMEDWLQEEEPPEPVIWGKPPPITTESITKGKELYTAMKCWECHGKGAKGDGPSAAELKDDWGFPIKVADLTQQYNFRGGHTVTDIFRTFTTGLNGTPMPAYFDVLSEENRWHLANFVKTLAMDKKPLLKTFWEKAKIQK